MKEPNDFEYLKDDPKDIPEKYLTNTIYDKEKPPKKYDEFLPVWDLSHIPEDYRGTLEYRKYLDKILNPEKYEMNNAIQVAELTNILAKALNRVIQLEKNIDILDENNIKLRKKYNCLEKIVMDAIFPVMISMFDRIDEIKDLKETFNKNCDISDETMKKREIMVKEILKKYYKDNE